MLSETPTLTNNALSSIPANRDLHQMLKTRKYDHIDEFLHQIQITTQSKELDPLLNNILLATRKICNVCNTLRDTIEWHQYVLDEAERQEEHLIQLLQDIVELLRAYDPITYEQHSTSQSELPDVENSTSEVLPGLLRKLRGLLLGNTASFRSSTSTRQNHYEETASEETISITETKTPIKPLCQQQAITQISSENKTEEQIPTPIKTSEHSSPHEHSLVIYGLGIFRVYRDGQLIKGWPNRKSKSLLKYLLWYRQHPISKELLMEIFWPESSADSARNNLNVTIYNLRQVLRESDSSFSYILFQDDCYLFNSELKIWADFEAFEEYFRKGQQMDRNDQLMQAILEYQAGEPLYEGELFEEDRYDEWLMPQRQTLSNHYIEILDRLSLNALENYDFVTCIGLCNKLLAVDSCHEDAHRRLMSCYIARGQNYLAMRQYFHCIEELKNKLCVVPSSDTVSLFQQIHTDL